MPSTARDFFTRSLLAWNRRTNTRQMPWKNETDPYRIWLSEIMLQQTRVDQGWPYYLRFIERFPNIQQLAAAPDDEVFKLWEGLGYYSRCRNLLHTARHITASLDGRFPETYPGLLALKGVGSYTAAAIASFAFQLPHAVVDGNVVRLLARYFGLYENPQTSGGKKAFEQLAQALLPVKSPAQFNQAIMDFGATVCMPRLPLCKQCPLNSRCVAYNDNKVMELPVKKTALSKRPRYFRYAVVQCNNHLLVRQRVEKDIWQSLYEFMLTELHSDLELRNACPVKVPGLAVDHRFLHTQVLPPQTLSHQTIYIRLCWYSASQMVQAEGYTWKNLEALEQLAWPRSLQHTWRHMNEKDSGGMMAAEPGGNYG